mgnify:CR=1 FL=1
MVAILISLLLPALSGAAEAGRTAMCMSNTRQLAIASRSFAHDHDQHLPAAQGQSLPGGVDSFWYGGGNFSEGTWIPEAGVMHGYLGNADVAGCPSLDDETRSFQGPVDYAYNVIYLGLILRDAIERNPRGERISRARSPSKTVAFYDSGRVTPNNPASGAFERTAFGFPPSGRFGPEGQSIPVYIPSFHGRHNGGRGVAVWLDGHVSTRTPVVYEQYTLGLMPQHLERHTLGDIDVDTVRDAPIAIPPGDADDVLFDLK